MKQLLHDFSGGTIDLSTGFICERAHEVAVKGKKELDEIFSMLSRSRYVHVDTTVTKNAGKNEAVT